MTREEIAQRVQERLDSGGVLAVADIIYALADEIARLEGAYRQIDLQLDLATQKRYENDMICRTSHVSREEANMHRIRGQAIAEILLDMRQHQGRIQPYIERIDDALKTWEKSNDIK